MNRGYWSVIGGLGGATVLLSRPLFKVGTAYGVGAVVGLIALAIYLTVVAPAVEDER